LIRRFFLFLVATSLLGSSAGVFADDEKPIKPTVKPVVKTVATAKIPSADAADLTEDIDRDREKQKAMDDVNAFLIESYKIKLDKTLAEVYQSVRIATKDNPELQSLLLRRILSEIETKTTALSERTVSPNRKKILIAVFTYMKADVESKIRSLEEK
jgi:hypothetical protein